MSHIFKKKKIEFFEYFFLKDALSRFFVQKKFNSLSIFFEENGFNFLE